MVNLFSVLGILSTLNFCLEGKINDIKLRICKVDSSHSK